MAITTFIRFGALVIMLGGCVTSSSIERFAYTAKPATVADPQKQIQAIIGADQVRFGDGHFSVKSSQGPQLVQFDRIARVDLVITKNNDTSAYGVSVVDMNLLPMLEWVVASREDAEKLADAITALMPPVP